MKDVGRGCTRCGNALLLWTCLVPLVASVGYSPVDRKVGLPAGGKTDAAGRYKLTAVRGGKPGAGTAIGDYAISITKVEFVPPEEPQPPPPAWWNPSMGPMPPPIRSVIPEAYGESATSGLRATLKAGRNTGPEFSFDLKADYTGKGECSELSAIETR